MDRILDDILSGPKHSGYHVVTATNLSDFKRSVEAWVEKGWTPTGGLAVYTEFSHMPTYAQALWWRA
ncbi:hypothetical protein [Rhodobacter sp. NSM]|uniref:hypothetical protein n=1 Tax=Rhodobacter sp. NSM TaxID=3457501 RepID=UPI003FD2B0B1